MGCLGGRGILGTRALAGRVGVSPGRVALPVCLPFAVVPVLWVSPRSVFLTVMQVKTLVVSEHCMPRFPHSHASEDLGSL